MQTLPEVLVVDDDALVREMLAFTLLEEFRVRSVATGTEAVAALEAHAPAAMLLDVVMPGIDGYDVLELRRQRGLAPDTRVVMLSADDDERCLVRCWALGADSYLTKPIDPATITAKLRSLLAGVPAPPTPV
ncbi:MAG: response regulator transcription factor [Microthrixaceae bacterium]